MTILFFSDTSWSVLYQRPQHLASLLSKEWPVLWIEPAVLGAKVHWSPMPISHNITRLGLPQLADPDSPIKGRLLRIAGALPGIQWLFARVQHLVLRRAAGHLDLDETVAVVQNFQFSHLVRLLGCKRVVFDYVNGRVTPGDIPQGVRKDWQSMLTSANEITTNTPALMQHIAEHGRSDVRLVSDGIDYGFFSSDAWHGQRPDDLPNDARIALYVGPVDHLFSFDFMEYLLSHMPDVEFVLIGSEHPEVRNDLIRMMKLPNFHFLGIRPYELLPGYFASAHVGFIPFQRMSRSVAVHPEDFYEYFAAGIPIVTTEFSPELSTLDLPVLISPTRERFALNLRESLRRWTDPDFRERLRNVARKNDWKEKAGEIATLLGLSPEDTALSHVP